ncbi:MAG: hypothetical protein V1494_02145 [Candidatus Diapherotrites archaeon]
MQPRRIKIRIPTFKQRKGYTVAGHISAMARKKGIRHGTLAEKMFRLGFSRKQAEKFIRAMYIESGVKWHDADYAIKMDIAGYDKAAAKEAASKNKK